MSSSVPSRSLLWLVDMAAIKHIGQPLPDLCMSLIAACVGRANIPRPPRRTLVTLEREIVIRGAKIKKSVTKYRIKRAFRWR
jgi:hypothetical protein